jgi:hypothetical protein
MKNENLKNEYMKFISSKDLRYFVTINFRQDKFISNEYQITSLNFLLKLLNKKLFSRRYKEKDSYLKVFLFREKKLHHTNSHYHLLVFNDVIFNDTSKPSFEEHFFNLIHKIKNENYEEILSSNSVSVKDVYSDDSVKYSLKTMYNNDDSFIFISSRDEI